MVVAIKKFTVSFCCTYGQIWPLPLISGFVTSENNLDLSRSDWFGVIHAVESPDIANKYDPKISII